MTMELIMEMYLQGRCGMDRKHCLGEEKKKGC